MDVKDQNKLLSEKIRKFKLNVLFNYKLFIPLRETKLNSKDVEVSLL